MGLRHRLSAVKLGLRHCALANGRQESNTRQRLSCVFSAVRKFQGAPWVSQHLEAHSMKTKYSNVFVSSAATALLLGCNQSVPGAGPAPAPSNTTTVVPVPTPAPA